MKLSDYSIFDNTLESILLLNSKQELVYCNGAFANLLAISPRKLKAGRNLAEITPQNYQALVACQQKVSIVQEVPLLSSENIDVRVQICVEGVECGDQSCWLLFIHDVSLEHRLQSKYRAELQQKEVFIQRLDRKLFEVSFLLEISSEMNRAGTGDDLFAFILELIGKKFNLQNAAFFQISDQGRKLVCSYTDATSTDASDRDWSNLKPSNGESIERIKTMGTKDILGELILVAKQKLSDEDLSLLRNAASQLIGRLEQELLYSKSITDEKTGLYNARFLQATLQKEVDRAERNQESFGLIVIDIDHFKKFNDTYGHQTGDEVLIHVSKQIRASIRNADIPARFGGEEFCVIAMSTDLEGIKIVMERIRKSIEDSALVTKDHGPLKVTASIGGAMFPIHASNATELFAKADAALYDCKRAGRNRSSLPQS